MLFIVNKSFVLTCVSMFPSVLWHCWFGDRKVIRSVESWVLICGCVTTWCDCLRSSRITGRIRHAARWLASVRWPGLSQLGQIVRHAQNSHPCLSFFFCPSKHEDGLCVLVDKVDKLSSLAAVCSGILMYIYETACRTVHWTI